MLNSCPKMVVKNYSWNFVRRGAAARNTPFSKGRPYFNPGSVKPRVLFMKDPTYTDCIKYTRYTPITNYGPTSILSCEPQKWLFQGTGHLAIRLDAMLQTEKLPACIANLDTALGGEECEGMSRRANHARWNAREGVGTIVGMLSLNHVEGATKINLNCLWSKTVCDGEVCRI